MTNLPPVPGTLTRARKRIDEYGSLVIFTSLAPLAVGGFFATMAVHGSQQIIGLNLPGIIIFITGLGALFASFFHLGRPWRAPLAIIHLTRSWLSREVILYGVFLLLIGSYSLLPIVNQYSLTNFSVGITGVIVGLAGTVATGLTYRLPARPSWNHWLTIVTFPVGALSTGFLFGLFLIAQFIMHAEVAAFWWVMAAVFLVFSGIITWHRSISLLSASVEVPQSHKIALASHRWILSLRLVFIFIAVILIASGSWIQYYAWIPAFLGEYVDRFLFFKTVISVSPRSRYL